MERMDYRKRLEYGNSKAVWGEIVNHVGSNKERLDNIMTIFFNADLKIIKRISQVVGIIGEQEPELMANYLPKMVDLLASTKIDAIKRNILRALQFATIPEALEGKLFDLTLTFMKSNEEALAIRVFSMTTLRKICEKYPELSQEVIPTLEIILDENKAGSIQSRGNKELKKLHSLQV